MLILQAMRFPQVRPQRRKRAGDIRRLFAALRLWVADTEPALLGFREKVAQGHAGEGNPGCLGELLTPRGSQRQPGETFQGKRREPALLNVVKSFSELRRKLKW